MLSFIQGIITKILKNSVVVSTGPFGIKIYMNRTNELFEGEECKIYTYFKVYEDDVSVYGFLDEKEKEVFEKLNLIQGVGPKTALSILRNINYEMFVSYVKSKDVAGLEKISGIGSKASFFINKLYKKFDSCKLNTLEYDNVFRALKSLGYNDYLISSALTKVQPGLDESTAFKKAIEVLKNA